MSVRNCAEIGQNLQKIITALMANNELVNLLYYTDKDPLSQPNLTDDEKKKEIFNNWWILFIYRIAHSDF